MELLCWRLHVLPVARHCASLVLGVLGCTGHLESPFSSFLSLRKLPTMSSESAFVDTSRLNAQCGTWFVMNGSMIAQLSCLIGVSDGLHVRIVARLRAPS